MSSPIWILLGVQFPLSLVLEIHYRISHIIMVFESFESVVKDRYDMWSLNAVFIRFSGLINSCIFLHFEFLFRSIPTMILYPGCCCCMINIARSLITSSLGLMFSSKFRLCCSYIGVILPDYGLHGLYAEMNYVCSWYISPNLAYVHLPSSVGSAHMPLHLRINLALVIIAIPLGCNTFVIFSYFLLYSGRYIWGFPSNPVVTFVLCSYFWPKQPNFCHILISALFPPVIALGVSAECLWSDKVPWYSYMFLLVRLCLSKPNRKLAASYLIT